MTRNNNQSTRNTQHLPQNSMQMTCSQVSSGHQNIPKPPPLTRRQAMLQKQSQMALIETSADPIASPTDGGPGLEVHESTKSPPVASSLDEHVANKCPKAPIECTSLPADALNTLPNLGKPKGYSSGSHDEDQSNQKTRSKVKKDDLWAYSSDEPMHTDSEGMHTEPSPYLEPRDDLVGLSDGDVCFTEELEVWDMPRQVFNKGDSPAKRK
ncbi:hypothetical protein CPB86DRAFT_801852 [Serendipita vermifera]|nr:hypothetical protein CPB86DRAFT_801852 [Serendipita vermifera]